MIQLYDHEMSGNSYKVRLFLELLHLDYEWIEVDLRKGEHKLPEYLALNPFGQVPLWSIAIRNWLMLKRFWCIWHGSIAAICGYRWMRSLWLK